MLQKQSKTEKTLRWTTCFLLAGLILIGLSSIGAAGNYVTSGHVGPNNTFAPWTLYDNGTVLIGGGTVQQISGIPGVSGQTSVWQAAGVHGSVTQIVFTEPVTGGTHLNGLFRNLTALTTIENIHYLDTSNTIQMARMFQDTHSLKELDLSSWNVGSVTTTSLMFYATLSLEELIVCSWDTSSVQTMIRMFERTGLTELNVSNWDTSSATHMEGVFGQSSLTELDLSGWDTSNVNNMLQMFWLATDLQVLHLGPNWVAPPNPNTWLPGVPNTVPFTGRWQNVDTGTIAEPTGTTTHTSFALMTGSNGAGETWVWERISLTVTFEAGPNGTLAGGAPQSVTVPWGSNLTERNIAVPAPSGDSGYQFAHWTSSQQAGTFTADQIRNHTITANTVYTAVFERIPHTVIFEASANGALVGGSPQNVTVLSGDTLTSVPAANGDTNYQFVHWISCSTPGSFSETEILTHVITANITFTAIFEAVGGNGNGGGGGNGTGNATIHPPAPTHPPLTHTPVEEPVPAFGRPAEPEPEVPGSILITLLFPIGIAAFAFTRKRDEKQ